MVKTNYKASHIWEKSLELSSCVQPKKCLNRGYSPEDRISQLPEDILVHILSLLTLKEAAQTSVLSSQWMTLWTHTSRLDFDATDTFRRIFQAPKILKWEMRKYVAWVNHVLYSHRRATLEEFRVCFQLGKRLQSKIDKWLEYAFARRVERLELNLSSYGCYEHHPSGSYTFPDRLINLGHGTTLGIHHNSFKSLKELCLKSVNVSDKVIEFVLLNCLFLERLVVLGSGQLMNLVVSGSSLRLKYLEIEHCLNLESITIRDSNIVSLKISEVGRLMVTNNTMLAEVLIFGGFPKFPVYLLSQLSCCLSQLEVLTLHAYLPEGKVRFPGFPELTGLKELVINVNAEGDKSLMGVTSFLKSCPNLQKFVLQLRWIYPSRTNRDREKAVACSLKYLKVIELSGYYGRTSDVELIEFFVENAVALDKIIVDPRNQIIVPVPDAEKERVARVCAKQQLEALVPRNIELVIL